jgi:saccharopine dehydrogenase-like NADP-dependent oxidoreductase
MSKIIVLGAGMVGSAMAIDLSKKHEVTSADVNQDSLDYLAKNYKIQTVKQDLNDKILLSELVKSYDLVISAVPGFMGFETIKTVIECGKNLVDISFLPEDVTPLDKLAKQSNVTAIMDFGVAPGIPNFIAGYYYERMKINNFEYMVGGLPKVRTFPFEYKAPFSPIDVIEEYTRPARYVENGVMINKPAMSDSELINFDKVGTLEAFNTDGLRSLIYTLPNIPNMKEKTLRYPGHIKLIQSLITAGFFDKKTIKIGNSEIVPFEFTTKILFDQWKLGQTEPEFTVMRIKLTGDTEEIIYELYDEYDPIEKLSSMARTTGFTGTSGAELILQKIFTKKGIFPPELVGKDEKCFNFVLDYLEKRNVIYRKETQQLK